VIGQAPELEGESPTARLNRYRAFDEVNAPYMSWQLDQFKPFLGNRVLEVGCGVGSIMAQLGPREILMGIDVEPDILEFARARFAGQKNHLFANLDITTLSGADVAELKRHRFDSILTINVLEHVKDDAAAVATMSEVLGPGGVLLVLVPAHPALYGAYDRMEGHFRRYTKRGLRDLISRSGLAMERMYRFNAVGAAGWWMQYRMLRRTIHSQGHFKLLQSILPALKAVESRLKPPIGLSLVAIARKPG
jgi:SAM-dependent methyltransferase